MRSTDPVVVFDLGNVLIEWERERLFAQLIHDPDELQYFLDNVLTLDANRRLDAGTPLPQVVAEVAAEHPEHRAHVLAFGERWRETIGEEISGSVELVGELSRLGVRLYALSNWGADTFASIENEFPFLRLFDGMVISGREGVTKPDPRIFDIICDRYEFAPEQALFIDDSPVNVAAAVALGFDAVLFDDAARLRDILVERRLLPD